MSRLAFGLKAHSGWAALVVLTANADRPEVVDRRRLELVGPDETFAKAPYHAAEDLPPDEARALVARGLATARAGSLRALRAEIERVRDAGHEVAVCAVLVGEPMPPWTVDEIRAVHVRMHKAEGMLYRDALAEAATACGLRLIGIPERRLAVYAAGALGTPTAAVTAMIAALGKSVGPPWAKDQKDAALAAWVALHGRSSG